LSFPRYPKYKDSGVEWLGPVPEYWEVKRLRFTSELNPSKAEIFDLDRNTAVSFLPMEAIGDDGKVSLLLEKTIGEVESGYTYFRDGDVTIAKITPCYENGKGALMRGLTNGVGFGTTELIVVRPKPEHISGPYLQYLFISQEFRRIGESHMYGAGGQKRVPDAFVRNFATAFPPPAEQATIAEFLDRETGKIDELVAEQRRLIELLKEKRQAVISHAVTRGLNPAAPLKPSGIEWLGDVPEHWRVLPMRMVANVVRGASPRPAGDPKYFGGEDVPWVTVAEITKDSAVYLTETESFLTYEGARQSTLFRSGTLIYSNSGATLGVPKILNIDACANDGVVAFLNLSDEVRREFLYHYLSSITNYIREKVKQGSGQPNLNTDIVKGLRFGVPPLTEQATIVQRITQLTDQFDTLTAEAQRAIDLLQERRTALISAAVTGQIDVRPFTQRKAA